MSADRLRIGQLVDRWLLPTPLLRAISRLRASPAARRYRAAAAEWVAAGRPALDPHPLAVAIERWWADECGRMGPDVHAHVDTQVDALSARNADWYGGVLAMRVWCVECGTHWRLDSAATCTTCDRSIGPCCLRDVRMTRWRDGTRACPYCSDGAIVG